MGPKQARQSDPELQARRLVDLSGRFGLKRCTVPLTAAIRCTLLRNRMLLLESPDVPHLACCYRLPSFPLDLHSHTFRPLLGGLPAVEKLTGP